MSEFEALRANDTDLAPLRTGIRSFLADDRARYGWEPAVDCWLGSWDADFSVRLAAAGFLGLTIPAEYGGRGLTHMHRYVVTEELLAHGAPVAAHWIADRQVAPGLLSYGSEEQRRRLLPRIAEGRLYSAIGMSEDGAGSDLAAVSTRATRTDDGWRLSGAKVWTSGAHLAHQVVVLARTSPLDPDHRHAGFSQFIVPMDAPGVTVSPILLMNGEHHFNEVRFDDVALADGDVLGAVGNGWHQVTAELGFERSGPERILSTATLLVDLVRTLGERDDAALPVGDVVARIGSLRQLSISVARSLSAGEDAASRAALVKDLGTRFEQDSVEIAAELLDLVDPTTPEAARLRTVLGTARVHSPLFTLRGGTNEVLRGVVAKRLPQAPARDELGDLVDEVGRQAHERRLGSHRHAPAFDDLLWSTLEETGLARISSSGAGPRESAEVLGGLARWAAAVPVAETDVLATWLAHQAGLDVPETGPLTVALADGPPAGGRIAGTARDVPWPQAGPVLLVIRRPESSNVAWLSAPEVETWPDATREPRGSVRFDVAESDAVTIPPGVVDELQRRGAWARCVQIVGALQTATELTAHHAGERVQFGRTLDRFQTVAHALAAMAGELERARAATALATAAAADCGFGSAEADYAITLAKVAVGRAVAPVCTIAHQLHGAIGVTAEHRLWTVTTRARGWADDFGTTGVHARALGRMALSAADPWHLIAGP